GQVEGLLERHAVAAFFLEVDLGAVHGRARGRVVRGPAVDDDDLVGPDGLGDFVELREQDREVVRFVDGGKDDGKVHDCAHYITSRPVWKPAAPPAIMGQCWWTASGGRSRT